MAANTTVKLEQNGVYRRFELQLVDGNDALVTLVDAVKNIEPGFKAQLVWKDADGDSILLGSDVEVREAVKQCRDGCLRVYVHRNNNMDTEDSTARVEVTNDKESESKDESPETETKQRQFRMPHWGVVCDGCGVRPIKGIRHKCNECADFDLCDTCKTSGDYHTEHSFTAIPPVMRNWESFRKCGPRGPHSPPRCSGSHATHERSSQPQGPHPGFGHRHGHCPPPFRAGFPGGLPPMFMNPMFMSGLPSMMEFMSVGQSQMQNLSEDEKLAHVQQAADNLTELAKSFLNVDLNINVLADPTEPAADQPTPEVPGSMIFGILNAQSNGATEEMVDNMQKVADYVAYMLRQHADTKVKITVTVKDSTAKHNDAESVAPSTSAKSEDEKAQDARNAEALSHLLRMGFSNESGWLSALVAAKHGNINQVLNAVQPHH